MCQRHYSKWLRSTGVGKCSVPECAGARYSNGMCSRHYERMFKRGTLSLIDRSPDVRFWAKVDKTIDGCWLWQGAAQPLGYGAFWSGERQVAAHRFSYELAGGVIPPGYHVDHLCVTPACVNPAHLEAVPPRENTRRAWERLAAAPHCATCRC